jgi:hypothetical protein
MKKLSLLFFSLLLFCKSTRAATITADMSLLLGVNAGNAQLTIKGYDLPQRYQGKLYLAATNYARLTNGFLNVTIPAPGRYDLTFPNANTTLRVIVPPSDDTYDISTMLTNVVVWVQRGISTELTPGNGISIVTNNPGTPNETLVISSTASGGSATNAYQLSISGAGLALSTNALSFLYTLSLNANLQGWGALATSAKQDHSANLDAWGALSTSAKQNHTTALDFWAGASIDGTTIVNTGGVLSAITGGTGNVTGDSASTDLEIPVFNGTTGKAVKRSTHFLSEYQPSLGFVPTSSQNVTDIVNSVTVSIDNLAPASGVNIAGVTSSTNFTPIHLGTGLAYDPATSNLNVTITGGSAAALSKTNFYIRDTNALILDFARAQTFSIGNLTNGILIVSNAWAITNLACHDVTATWHQWTNGQARILVLKNAQGNLTTNGTYVQTTNANATDLLIFRLADATGTNVVLSAITNCSSYTDTNSLLTGSGGGGGGGGSWSLVAHTAKQGNSGDTTTDPFDATGAKLLFVSSVYTGGTLPTIASSPANTWVAKTNVTFGGGNPRMICYECISPSVSASMTITIGNVSGSSVAVQAWDAPSTPVGGAVTDSAQTGNGGQFTGNWTSTSTKPGSITPANPSILIVSAWFDVNTTSVSIDSSFSQSDAPVFNAPGVWMGYKIKSNTTAENPALTGNAAADAGSFIAEYH